MIRDLREQGKTIVLSGHLLADMQDICDRIAILHEGELQAYGNVKELLQDVNRVEVQASGLQMTDGLRRDLDEVLRKHGGKLDSMTHPTTTLEEYFLRIVEESKTRPGRRFIPGQEGDKARRPAAPEPAPAVEKVGGAR